MGEMDNINDCECGSSAYVFCGDKDLYSVDCRNCENSTERIYEDYHEAIDVWNSRKKETLTQCGIVVEDK